MKYGIIIFTAILLALAVLLSACATSNADEEPVFCTADAKLCPDGSYVGRDSANNCEFFECPNGSAPVSEMFECGNKSYPVSEKGFCARALLLEGTSCVMTDFGDIIVPNEEYVKVKSCALSKELSLTGACSSDVDCAVGGCSNQICGSNDEVSGLATTCEFRNDFACLKETSCSCINNICQWAVTPKYEQCVEELE